MKVREVKKHMRVAQFQYGLFRREYDRVKKNYDAWIAGQQERADKVGLKYFDYDELYSDYIVGKLEEEEFKYQKKWYYLIAADNWFRREKLEWLKENMDMYKRKADAMERLYKDADKAFMKERSRKAQRKEIGRRKMYYDPTRRISKYNQPKIEQNKEKFGKRREAKERVKDES